jgi:hypothetical protein
LRNLRQLLERIARQRDVASARSRLDQLGQRPHRDVPRGDVLAGLAGCRRRRLGDGGLDQRDGLGRAAAQRREQHRGTPGGTRPGHFTDRVGLDDQGRGGREISAGGDGGAQGVQHDRQLAEGSGLPGGTCLTSSACRVSLSHTALAAA